MKNANVIPWMTSKLVIFEAWIRYLNQINGEMFRYYDVNGFTKIQTFMIFFVDIVKKML